MKENFLVTRPLNESVNFAKNLEELGFSTIIQPLIEINVINAQINHDKDNIYLLTSVNTLPSIKNLKKDANIFFIGDLILEHLEKAGFNNITKLAYKASELVEKIKERNFYNKKFIYLSGNDISVDIDKELRKAGYEAERIIVYEALQIENIDDEVLNLIKNRKINNIAFFSSRTIDAFMKLVGKYSLEKCLSDTNLFSLSNNISNIALSMVWKKVIVCQEPSLKSMIKLIIDEKRNSY